MSLDVPTIRKEFPILAREIDGAAEPVQASSQHQSASLVPNDSRTPGAFSAV